MISELSMKKDMNFKLRLADLLTWIEGGYAVTGNPDITICGFGNLKDAVAGDLSFVQSRKYASDAENTRASVLLIPNDLSLKVPESITCIRVENPSKVLSQICGKIEILLFPVTYGGIHTQCIVSEGVDLGENVSLGAFTTIGRITSIGPNSWIGARVSIGANCQIGKGVFIADNCVIGDYTVIGDYSRIHSGVVIGTPGFGYEFNRNKGCHEPIPQIGRVRIGSYVEIGANTTVDRARLGETVIGDGTKIDNLVQVAHNVKIGKHCILCAFVGVSGSVTIGDYAVLAGRAGVADHVDIANGVQLGAGAGLTSSVSVPGSKLWGTPAVEMGAAMKIVALQRKLPDLFKRMGQIEKQLSGLVETSSK